MKKLLLIICLACSNACSSHEILDDQSDQPTIEPIPSTERTSSLHQDEINFEDYTDTTRLPKTPESSAGRSRSTRSIISSPENTIVNRSIDRSDERSISERRSPVHTTVARNVPDEADVAPLSSGQAALARLGLATTATIADVTARVQALKIQLSPENLTPETVSGVIADMLPQMLRDLTALKKQYKKIVEQIDEPDEHSVLATADVATVRATLHDFWDQIDPLESDIKLLSTITEQDLTKPNPQLQNILNRYVDKLQTDATTFLQSQPKPGFFKRLANIFK